MHRLFLALLLASCSYAALAEDFDAVEAKLKAAMQSDVRTAAEVDRDANRKPVETLEFFGLRDDMKVVELLPGGGWYTKLLAPVLAENGEFFVALGTGTVKANLLSQEGGKVIGGEDGAHLGKTG